MSVPVSTQPQPQSGQSRRKFWFIVGGLIAIVVIAFAVIVGVIASREIHALKQNGPIPERYYLNIMSGDYAQAYTYLESNATINGQPLNQQAFLRLAKAADAQYGTVHGVVFSQETDGPHITATVSRGSRSYDVHLALKQENGVWKISTADGI